jgi:uncharacterized protein (DUF952 family)
MIYHIAIPAEWDAARQRGRYEMSTLGHTIAEVGYLHASDSLEQAARVALFLYGNTSDGLTVLEMERKDLENAGLRVVCEPIDPSDPTSEKFPHIYGGPLPTSVVRQTEHFTCVNDIVRAAGLPVPSA